MFASQSWVIDLLRKVFKKTETSKLYFLGRGPEVTFQTGVGTVLRWVQVYSLPNNKGEQITFNTSNYQFTLPKGHIYKLIAQPKYGNAAGYRYFQWYNVTTGAVIGHAGQQENNNTGYNGHVPAAAVVDLRNATSDQNFRVQVTAAGNNVNVLWQSTGHLEIEQLDYELF